MPKTEEAYFPVEEPTFYKDINIFLIFAYVYPTALDANANANANAKL